MGVLTVRQAGDTVSGSSAPSGWFTVEVGALIRGQVRREIEKAAWDRGLEIETRESKGLFESVYRFTVTGDGEHVRRFLVDTQKWMGRFG